ncbi:hypothetical protein A5768_11355 [Mycolicibacterium fortuitum]|uniref:hypothetical protein n=1 Tax=Mycolicibacterium fortuitum TaxID=1766 RepID=UPI0007EAC18E|nr:hypothetical protein [Mycolicibacterium fortuitum]OBG11808.1 hypothetical protein A5768_11355 [Mycolicibacterium fortuitum]
MGDRHLSTAQIATELQRAGLDPASWDLAGLTAAVNARIGQCRVELASITGDWSAADRQAHLDEFGVLPAVDFYEYVIEAGPDTAPWPDLQRRINAGEFDQWPAVWTHHPDTTKHAIQT